MRALDFAPLIADMGGIFSQSRDQGLQDLPLCICQVRWVGFPAWHHFPPPLSFFSLLLLSFIGFMTPPLHLLRPFWMISSAFQDWIGFDWKRVDAMSCHYLCWLCTVHIMTES